LRKNVLIHHRYFVVNAALFFCEGCSLKHAKFRFAASHKVIIAEAAFVEGPASKQLPPATVAGPAQVVKVSVAARRVVNSDINYLPPLPDDNEPWVPENVIEPKKKKAIEGKEEGKAEGKAEGKQEVIAPAKATSKKQASLKEELEKCNYDVTEHLMSPVDVVRKYNGVLEPFQTVNFEDPTKSLGLTQSEADLRLARDGPNEMTPAKGVPECVKFLH